MHTAKHAQGNLDPYHPRINAVPTPLFFDNLAKGVRSGWGSGTPPEHSPLGEAQQATVLHGVENAKRIAVYTVTGVQVLSLAVHGEKETNLQVESLAEGVYIVMIEAANGESKAMKLVVRR